MDGRENENKISSAAPQPIFTPPASDGPNNHASNLPAPVGSISPVENSGTFASSGQGDVILNNAPRKSALNKKPLIIGAVAIIITIVIMIFIVFIIKKNQPLSLSETYNTFFNNLNNGPGDEYQYDPGNPETQERFYTIAGEMLTSSEQDEYYKSLEDSYRNLRDQLKESKKESLRRLGEQLEDIFPIHFAMLRQSNINDQLIYDIAYGNNEAAKQLIAKISHLADDNQVNRAEKTASNLAKYLEVTYDLYSIYQAQGCIQSDGLSFDLDCVKNISTSKVLELRQQAKDFLSLAEINSELLNQDFDSLLNKIKLETEKDNG